MPNNDRQDDWRGIDPYEKWTLETAVVERAGLLALLSCLVICGVVAWQAFDWLKTGKWQSISIFDALISMGVENFTLTNSSWAGLNRILWWILDLHAGFGIFAASLLLGSAWGYAGWHLSILRRRA